MLIIKHSLLSWWLVRISVLLTIPSVFYDPEILILVQSLLFLHIKTGLETIVNDYVHERVIITFYLVSLRFLSLKLTYYALEFLL